MEKVLPARPNLDHLRRQSKALLAALETGDPAALSAIAKHLPAAKGMSATQIREARFRLADAQSAVARQTGFASWPQLARHVEQLRGMEGTWEFVSLEVDGSVVPAGALSASRLLIDGDRFRTESPEATYEGIFNIDVESDPHGIDIEFVAGPEAGNWNYGLFRLLDADRLEICLDMTGKGRPAGFRTSPGSGHALETLRRASRSRPESVTGGSSQRGTGTDVARGAAGTDYASCGPAPASQAGGAANASPNDCGFEHIASPTLTKLQGEWTSEKLVRDGQEFPKGMRATGRRVAKDNEIKITFGGQLIIHALVRINERTSPMHVDYYNLAGAAKGTIQHGIMRWDGEIVCFCMAAPGQLRPDEFVSSAGSGRTLSHWRLKA